VTIGPIRRGVSAGRPAATTTATDPAVIAACPVDAEPGVSVEVAEATIQRLFGVGMTLASCANRVDQPAAARLVHAIGELDHIIRELRTAIFDRLRSSPPTPAGESEQPRCGAEAIAADLQQLAAALNGLSARDHGVAHLAAVEDARWAICRAGVALREADAAAAAFAGPDARQGAAP